MVRKPRGIARGRSRQSTRPRFCGRPRLRAKAPNGASDEGQIGEVPATALRKGDLVRVEKNDVIPADGEVVDGIAYVDESAVTGEAAPVLKEAGTDMFSFVTAGTTIVSDWLLSSSHRRAGQELP